MSTQLRNASTIVLFWICLGSVGVAQAVGSRINDTSDTLSVTDLAGFALPATISGETAVYVSCKGCLGGASVTEGLGGLSIVEAGGGISDVVIAVNRCAISIPLTDACLWVTAVGFASDPDISAAIDRTGFNVVTEASLANPNGLGGFVGGQLRTRAGLPFTFPPDATNLFVFSDTTEQGADPRQQSAARH